MKCRAYTSTNKFIKIENNTIVIHFCPQAQQLFQLVPVLFITLTNGSFYTCNTGNSFADNRFCSCKTDVIFWRTVFVQPSQQLEQQLSPFLTHSPLNCPCRSMSLLRLIVMLSVLTVRDNFVC